MIMMSDIVKSMVLFDLFENSQKQLIGSMSSMFLSKMLKETSVLKTIHSMIPKSICRKLLLPCIYIQ